MSEEASRTSRNSVKVVEDGCIKSTLKSIQDQRKVDGVLVIGSFTVMREARQYFGVEDPIDE